MRATFALLADTQVHNFVRKTAWEVHQKYRTGTIVCRLPPHISLKQPFQVSDLAALEDYMGRFVRTMRPFEVELDELQVVPTVYDGAEVGILWLNVYETGALRQLHLRLNQELSQQFGNTQAPFDGSEYHFHMTVAMGGQPLDVYQQIYAGLSSRRINLRYIVSELAMFVYDEPRGSQIEFLTYKILPIDT